jgi:hypothetical protein
MNFGKYGPFANVVGFGLALGNTQLFSPEGTRIDSKLE